MYMKPYMYRQHRLGKWSNILKVNPEPTLKSIHFNGKGYVRVAQ